MNQLNLYFPIRNLCAIHVECVLETYALCELYLVLEHLLALHTQTLFSINDQSLILSLLFQIF